MRIRAVTICLLVVINIMTLSGNANDNEPSSWFIEKISMLQEEGQLDIKMFSNYKGKISRKDFAYLGVRLYEIYTGLEATTGDEFFIDTQDESVLKAKHIGIVNGYPDGTFKPDQSIRRDELAHLFVNVLKVAKAGYKEVGTEIFSDDAFIQSWAKNSVYIARENGLIGGVGNNQFNPSGNATREEALIIFYRGLHEPSIVQNKALQIDNQDLEHAFLSLEVYWPNIIDLYERGFLKEIVYESLKGTVLLEFENIVSIQGKDEIEQLFFSWNRQGLTTNVTLSEGDYFLVSSPIVKETILSVATSIQAKKNVLCDSKGIIIQRGPDQSLVIADVKVIGDNKNKPWILENSSGDLWFTTWAEDGNLYSSWGDGFGIIDKNSKNYTDLGIALISGLPNEFSGKNIYKEEIPDNEEEAYEVNDKPSSLIYINHQLIGQFHRPLEDPNIGYLAVSEDGGSTWEKYLSTPWTKDNESPFRCMFFINQGQDYSLNQDGYVYALGIGKEWGWSGEVYLARVKKENILDYEDYEYLSEVNDETKTPKWSENQQEAKQMSGIVAFQQFSAVYHPGIQRYIAMTNQWVFDAPNPWGPWTISGEWLQSGWLGYQPGIISKDMGEETFWFTESGQPVFGDELPYQLCTGQIQMMMYQE